MPTPAEALAAAIAAREWAQARAEKLLAAAAKAKVAKPVQERLRAALEHSARRTKELRTIPTGDEALKRAEKKGEEFLTAERFGLYRGELLCAFADFWLEDKLDPVKGGAWLKRAEKWLADVENAEKALRDLSVPEAARSVTAPPPSTFSADEFGNIGPAAPAPGQVANRRTAEWYLDDLRSQVCAWQGFLAFMDGDGNKAKQMFTAYGRLNRYVNHCEKHDLPNPLHRLLVRCDAGTFRRSTKEELKGFQSKQRRFVVFMADYHAECEQADKALRLYRRLQDGEFGKLSPSEEAYVLFATGWSLWCHGVEHDRPDVQAAAKKALLPFRDRKDLRHAPIAPRALVALGNVIGYLDEDSPNCDREMADVYWLAANGYPQAPHAQDALYYIGRIGIDNPDLREEGLKALRRLKKDYPTGQYSELVEKALKEIEGQGKH